MMVSCGGHREGSDRTHEGFGGREGDAATVAAGNDDGLAADNVRKGFGDLEGLCIVAELGMSGRRWHDYGFLNTGQM